MNRPKIIIDYKIILNEIKKSNHILYMVVYNIQKGKRIDYLNDQYIDIDRDLNRILNIHISNNEHYILILNNQDNKI